MKHYRATRSEARPSYNAKRVVRSFIIEAESIFAASKAADEINYAIGFVNSNIAANAPSPQQWAIVEARKILKHEKSSQTLRAKRGWRVA